MLKKLYQKNGIIHIYDQEYYQNKDIEMCFIMVNNYDKDKNVDIDSWKKKYYESKGITYPQTN